MVHFTSDTYQCKRRCQTLVPDEAACIPSAPPSAGRINIEKRICLPWSGSNGACLGASAHGTALIPLLKNAVERHFGQVQLLFWCSLRKLKEKVEKQISDRNAHFMILFPSSFWHAPCMPGSAPRSGRSQTIPICGVRSCRNI